MKLRIVEELEGEIAHFYEPSTSTNIFSKFNTFWGSVNATKFEFSVPVTFKQEVFGTLRVNRRLLRLDKSSAAFNYQRDGIVVLYQGIIYFYDLRHKKLITTGRLRQCRNVLHCGIAVTKEAIYFGEYGANTNREAVPVWRSTDGGRSWSIIFEFSAGKIRHVHGVQFDQYSESLWITTGDFAGECYLVNVRKENFEDLIMYGDGNQKWRPVSLLFDKQKIYWVMDSQLETSYLQVFDRRTKQLEQKRDFPGPVWYSKRLLDNVSMLATTVEIGSGSKIKNANVYASTDCLSWNELVSFRKDFLPLKYFKFGVVGFADGAQDSSDFVMFGEALNNFDGKIFRAMIE